MTARKPRRQVLAELLLICSPRRIEQHRDEFALSIDFDSIAELHHFLTQIGQHTPELLITPERTLTDQDRTYQDQRAYPSWHGWEIYASAHEYAPAAPLDETTTARLAELAEVTR